MRIHFTEEASRDLDAICRYIGVDSPAAARRTVTRIRASTEPLRYFPNLGRSGIDHGTRGVVVRGLPYVIVYEIDEATQTVLVLNIIHGARSR